MAQQESAPHPLLATEIERVEATLNNILPLRHEVDITVGENKYRGLVVEVRKDIHSNEFTIVTRQNQGGIVKEIHYVISPEDFRTLQADQTTGTLSFRSTQGKMVVTTKFVRGELRGIPVSQQTVIPDELERV